MMEVISEMPDYPRTLPSVFLSTFLRQCFPRELPLVSFEQAFDALNYLDEIERRKRRQVQAAFEHLGLGEDGSYLIEAKQILPEPSAYRLQLLEQEKNTEALYAQLYIALRRWTMINELRQEPLVQKKCRALHRHLYSVDAETLQTKQLTSAVLNKEQKRIYEYIEITAVRGYYILDKLMRPAARSSEMTAWPSVHACLDRYLRLISETAFNCTRIMELQHSTGLDYIDQANKHSKKRRIRKTDSGVSFGSISTFQAVRPSRESRRQPKTIQSKTPNQLSPARSRLSTFSKKSFSTLERLVAEFRVIRASKIAKRNKHHKRFSKDSADSAPDRSFGIFGSKRAKLHIATSNSVDTQAGNKVNSQSPFASNDLKRRASSVNLDEIEITEEARLAAVQGALRDKLLKEHGLVKDVACT